VDANYCLNPNEVKTPLDVARLILVIQQTGIMNIFPTYFSEAMKLLILQGPSKRGGKMFSDFTESDNEISVFVHESFANAGPDSSGGLHAKYTITFDKKRLCKILAQIKGENIVKYQDGTTETLPRLEAKGIQDMAIKSVRISELGIGVGTEVLNISSSGSGMVPHTCTEGSTHGFNPPLQIDVSAAPVA